MTMNGELQRILLIEDIALEAELYTRLYQMTRKAFHGEVVIEAANTLTAGEESILNSRPDIIVLDLNLPDSGQNMELSLKFLRERAPVYPPIVVLTGMPDTRELRRLCILAGAEDFMAKTAVHRAPEILVERIYVAHLRRVRKEAP